MNKEDIRNLWAIVVITIVTIILLAILGCSPQRKLNRLIDKHPRLLRMDTILWSDTLIRWGIRVDTIVPEPKYK